MFENKELQEKVISWLIATPKALGLLVCSFLSGQLWFFIITTYLKENKKGNKYLKKFWAKLVLGVIWFAIINLPIHLIRQGIEITETNIFANILYTILYGFVIQGVISILIISLKTEK